MDIHACGSVITHAKLNCNDTDLEQWCKRAAFDDSLSCPLRTPLRATCPRAATQPKPSRHQAADKSSSDHQCCCAVSLC
uniref:Uncharacterized protein n=1 Tax=Haplochromis burtoni TaxID=8153 RepID=A0A3Q2V0J3_HAPBU